MASDLAISVKGVYKKYGRGKKAKHVLKGLDMEVPYYTMWVGRITCTEPCVPPLYIYKY